jgi:hypothetical protein
MAWAARRINDPADPHGLVKILIVELAPGDSSRASSHCSDVDLRLLFGHEAAVHAF